MRHRHAATAAQLLPADRTTFHHASSTRAAAATVCASLPPNSTRRIVFELEPRFLRVHEYPFDAERGLAVPGVQVRLRNPHRTWHHRPVHVRVPLPDASMSGNVACISVTVLALLLISLLRMCTALQPV